MRGSLLPRGCGGNITPSDDITAADRRPHEPRSDWGGSATDEKIGAPNSIAVFNLPDPKSSAAPKCYLPFTRLFSNEATMLEAA